MSLWLLLALLWMTSWSRGAILLLVTHSLGWWPSIQRSQGRRRTSQYVDDHHYAPQNPSSCSVMVGLPLFGWCSHPVHQWMRMVVVLWNRWTLTGFNISQISLSLSPSVTSEWETYFEYITWSLDGYWTADWLTDIEADWDYTEPYGTWMDEEEEEEKEAAEEGNKDWNNNGFVRYHDEFCKSKLEVILLEMTNFSIFSLSPLTFHQQKKSEEWQMKS